MNTIKVAIAIIAGTLVATQWPVDAFAQSDDSSSPFADEIIVTARKTSESLQEVPLSISVLSGDFLENARLDDVQDMLIRVPGIGFGQPFKSYVPIAIRGASTQDDSIGVDPNVSIFIDGVYVGSTTSIAFDLMDLQRVEVLKGPQGTVFGRNTNGGVIHYVTRNPDEEFRAATTFSFGNDDRIEVSGFVNGGISDNWSGSLSARSRTTSGHTPNLVTGNTLGQENLASMRGKLRYAPDENLDVIIGLDYTSDQTYGTPRHFTGPRPGLLDVDSPFTNDPDLVAQDLDGNYDRVGGGLSLTVRKDTGLGTFHSITAYRDFDGKLFNFDFDAVNGRTADGRDTTEAFTFQQTTLTSFSQEFRLDWSIGDSVDLVTGVYYLDENQFRIEHLAANGIPGSSFFADVPRDILSQEVDTTSWAVFTDAQFHLSDRFTLSAGLRWSDDTKDGTTVCEQAGPFFCQFEYSFSYSDSWSEPSWRVIADFQATENIMAYASYTRGYKSGGFSNASSGDGATLAEVGPLLSTAYLPEFADSFELGLRMVLADGRLTLNPTLFSVDYEDVQFLFNNGVSFVGGNIGEAENQGIEIDAQWAATDNLGIWATYVYQDSQYGGDTDLFGEPVAGNQLQLTPETSFTGGFNYEAEMANGKAWYASADVVQKSRQFDDATNGIDTSTEFKDLYNLRIGYRPSERVDVSLWVQNLTDERFAVGTNNGLDGFVYTDAEIAAGAESLWQTFTPPRTYGVTVRVEFD